MDQKRWEHGIEFDQHSNICYDLDNYTQRCAHKTGEDWVPGGESRRTASDPEGSSAKAFLLGVQDYLVIIGSMSISASGD